MPATCGIYYRRGVAEAIAADCVVRLRRFAGWSGPRISSPERSSGTTTERVSRRRTTMALERPAAPDGVRTRGARNRRVDLRLTQRVDGDDAGAPPAHGTRPSPSHPKRAETASHAFQRLDTVRVGGSKPLSRGHDDVRTGGSKDARAFETDAGVATGDDGSGAVERAFADHLARRGARAEARRKGMLRRTCAHAAVQAS
jgi:hypothetical protein